MKHSRFTVSIPTELLDKADKCLRKPDEGRSAFIQRLLDDAVWEAEDREKAVQWRKAYEEQPQTEDEIGWMLDPNVLKHLEVDPWEDDATG